MLSFEIVNPTRILFGNDQWERLKELLNDNVANKNLMLAYGGGSIHKTGIYDKIISLLEGFNVIPFSGIEANPQYTTLMKGVELARANDVAFILAVGGGSVIDGVKFMSGAYYYDGDPWDVLIRKEGCVFEKALPYGTVLTLPATGSESNSGAVISRSELEEKRTMGGPLFFPVFSLMNPEVVATLPERQIANGIADAFFHTLEQYLTYPTDNLLQEREAEAILLTLIEIADPVLKNPTNYKLASNLMWCANHALNGNLRCGVPTDWATHMIAHELTALYGIDHARTLAIIGPRLYEVQFEEKLDKLAQYGQRVWKLSGEKRQVAQEAIKRTEAFFQSLGIKTKISDYTEPDNTLPERIKKRFIDRGWLQLGERRSVTPERVAMIVDNAMS